jgi:hypothetical protein
MRVRLQIVYLWGGKKRVLEKEEWSLSFACSYHSYLSLHQRGVTLCISVAQWVSPVILNLALPGRILRFSR